jgi:hypothetical protein
VTFNVASQLSVRKVVALSLLLAVGCKHEPSVVGKWTGTLSNSEVTVDLQPDQTMSIGVKVESMGADISGAYKIDDKNLTLDFKSYKLKAVPDNLKGLADQLTTQLISKPWKAAYHFNSEDALAVTYNGTTDIWTRVKESE